MFRMFKLIQTGPEGSDCTAPYEVALNGEYTVEQFVKDVILDKRECGSIYTVGHEKMCSYQNVSKYFARNDHFEASCWMMTFLLGPT